MAVMHFQRPWSSVLLLGALGVVPASAADLTTPGANSALQNDILMPQEESGSLRAGPLDVRAAAAIAFGFDSNVNAVADPDDAQGVAIGQLLLRADNRGSRQNFSAQAFLTANRYEESADLDATEFGVASDWTSLLSPRDTLELSLDAQRRFERRTEIETPTDIPVSLYDDLRFSARQTHAFNRLSMRASADAQRLQYAAASQQFRDRSLYRGELRASYSLSSDLSWFATGYFNRDEFDSDSPLVASADTTGGLIGISLQNEILDVELGAGYFERVFEDGGALDGIALRGALAWRPTRLTQVRAELTRADEPTQVAGAFGKIRNEALLRVSHEYSRNLSLFAGARLVLDEFVAIDRDDTLYSAELGASWRVGRHSMLSFTYDYGSRHVESLDRGFVRHVANLSFIGRL